MTGESGREGRVVTESRNAGDGKTGPQERPISRIGVSRDAIGTFCRRRRVTELAVLGSVLRDDFGPDGVVDVLLRFDPGARHPLFDIVDMEEELSEALGRDVHLMTRDAVENIQNHILRKTILESAQVIHAA